METDTAQLRAFVTIASTGHIGRAAERLRLTQQGVSKRLAQLERRLGLRLADRHSGGVRLTAAGQRLLPHARTIVAAWDVAVEELHGDRRRTLIVDGLYEPLAPHLWLRGAAADPRFTVRAAPRDIPASQVEAVLGGYVDVAFGRANTSPWPRELSRAVALLEPLALLTGPGHHLARRRLVRTAELSDLDLWFPGGGSPSQWRQLATEFESTFDVGIRDSRATVSFAHFLETAESDASACTIIGLAMEPPPPPLRAIPMVDPVPVFPWAAIWPSRIPRATVDLLLEHVDARHLVTVDQAADHERVWMPEADREWITAT